MSHVLVTIKRAILAGQVVFSEKARFEMKADQLSELDIVESILNADAIYKKIRSTNPYHKGVKEYLYIIQSPNFEGIMIYTKGKLVREAGKDTFYFLISSKRAF